MLDYPVYAVLLVTEATTHGLADAQWATIRQHANNLKEISPKNKSGIDVLQRDLQGKQATEQPLCNIMMASEQITRRATPLF